MSTNSGPHDALSEVERDASWWESVPYVVVRDAVVVEVSAAVDDELGCDAQLLLGSLQQLGTRLDDATFHDVCAGNDVLRVRLGPDLLDRPIRLRRLGDVGPDGEVALEVRSLADEFRLESLLRRGATGHMLISPRVELQWSMTSNELADALPGDNPMNWVELMDADDMQALGTAIASVGADPNLRQTVRHRLNADRTYTIIDTVESAVHDPDLRAVLVRSRLEDNPNDDVSDGGAANDSVPYAGISVSDHMPIGVILASLTGKVLHRNAVAAELVGARAGQLVVPDGDESWMMSRLTPDHSARYQAVFAAACAGQSAHCTVPSPFEPGRWLRMSISPAAASTVVMTIEDTTELAEAERALRASNRLLEALDSHSEDLVVVFDAVGRARYSSSSAQRQLAQGVAIKQIDDVVGYVHAADRALVGDALRRVRSNPSASETMEFRFEQVRVESGDDEVGRWHHATMTNLLDDPDVQGLVLTVRDIHERHLVERELRFKATHDALTTLPDRAALQTRLETQLHDTRLAGQRTALMFCDIDNFKLINDRAGHRVGDQVLTTVADRLRSALRASDFVGRFGGDEFVVVAPHVTDEDHALELAHRVFATVSGPTRCDDIDVEVSVSMGVAITDAECTTAAGLLHRADEAMYDAKRQGRGRVSLYSLRDGARAEAAGDGGQRSDGEPDDLDADLSNAISERKLTLHYQPIVPLRDGLPRGYESLARWEHASRGLISAHDFLGRAEAIGLTTELGDELLRLACEDQRAWFGPDSGFVCVNVSAAQLSHANAATSFLDRIQERGSNPEQLVVELTESAFAQGAIVQTNLDTFRDAGVRIFLDDFGVGYSSLSHLHHFPVDGIKIDASVINPTVDDSLVRLIVGVATTLDIRTVAEGVETAEQLDALVRLGVDYAQGYFLGRPNRIPEARSRI